VATKRKRVRAREGPSVPSSPELAGGLNRLTTALACAAELTAKQLPMESSPKRSRRQTAGLAGGMLDRLAPSPGAQDGGVAQFKENLRQVMADPQQFAHLLAEMERLPKYQPPEVKPREGPFWTPKLYGVLLTEAENILAALGKPRDAWQAIEFHPYAGGRFWGCGADAELILGADSPAWAAAKIAAVLHCAAEVEAERGRPAGGRAAARKRHQEHVETKVKPYRDEYRKRLQAGERSPDIIRAMAARYQQTQKHMRDLIKPRARKLETYTDA
jgi:hypothetical protein